MPILVFCGAWHLGGVAAIGDDLIYYFPVRQYIGEQIRGGELPLWNPLTNMGSSLAADPQSGMWYPTTYLFAVLPPHWAYPIGVILHFIIAGAGMYRFLRCSKYDWRAAFLGALAFEFSGYLVAHRSHLTIHQAAAWIPWILYGWHRFADTGRYRHFALASACFGLQLLVQHTQPSIITAAVVTAYTVVVLWPKRFTLWWEYPVGMGLGAMLGAIQLFPTWFQFADSGRGTAAYYLFIENSWVFPSVIMFLFPMFFGVDTPTSVWRTPWWGMSHFCEQWAYPMIAILLLAAASSVLIRKREILFWWIACLVTLLFAVGDLTPVSKLLFHVPIYRSLRVPARWIIVWSLAMPVLAAAVLSTIIHSPQQAKQLAQRIHWLATRALPIAAAICLALAIAGRLLATKLAQWIPVHLPQPEWNRIHSALQPGNPAVWWPILIMAFTAWCLVHWSRTRNSTGLLALFAIFLVDLVSIAGFIDVDNGTYKLADLQTSPPLTETLRQMKIRPGDRILVPRSTASYDRPLEILWPLSNLRDRIPTLNGYGPLWSTANRQLFRFMAWGSSEEMLAMLRNVPLLQAMGARFLVVRSEEERALMQAALTPSLPHPELLPIPGTEKMTPVLSDGGLLWPIQVDTPGLYELQLDAEPVIGSPSRWFVRLETNDAVEIGRTRCIDPVDLSLGTRRVRFVFIVETAPGTALVRIKSEMGQALSAAHGTFGQIANFPSPLVATGDSTWRAGEGQGGGTQPWSPWRHSSLSSSLSLRAEGITHRSDLPDNISIYEVAGTAELVWLAKHVQPVENLTAAIDGLLRWRIDTAWDHHAFVQADIKSVSNFNGQGQINYRRPSNHELQIETTTSSEQVLVFNESYDEGWKAMLDDQQLLPVRRVNALCQGVIVPSGRHRIVFRYCPQGLKAGMYVSAVAAVVLLSMGLMARRKKWNSTINPKSTDNFVAIAT